MPNNRSLTLSKLKPTDVVKAVNSTPLGTVIGTSQVYRHFEMGGFRIASNEDERCINLGKYCAWLIDQLDAARNAEGGVRSYAERREAARAALAEQSLLGRDIGELPEVENPERKAACRLNFTLFCETYFPEVYQLEWSPDHLRAIAKIEKAVLKGGLFALAMSRGSGKSSLTETAAIWAMLYGHREFVVLIGASESAVLLALRILDRRKLADVAPRERLLGLPTRHLVAVPCVVRHRLVRFVVAVDEPCDVGEEVDAPRVLPAGDAVAAHLEVAVHLRRTQDRAVVGRVHNPHDLGRLQLLEYRPNRHGTPPS